MAEMSQQEITDFFSEIGVANLCTVRPDGRPHVAPVGYIVEDGIAFVMAPANTVKFRNLRQNPKVALSIATVQPPNRYVVLEGEGRATEDNLAQVLERICLRYYPEQGSALASEWLAAGGLLVLEIKVNKILSWKAEEDVPHPN